jgi:hypothetical protein
MDGEDHEIVHLDDPRRRGFRPDMVDPGGEIELVQDPRDRILIGTVQVDPQELSAADRAGDVLDPFDDTLGLAGGEQARDDRLR